MAYQIEDHGFRIVPRDEFFALDRLQSFIADDYSKVSFTKEDGDRMDRDNMKALQSRAGEYDGAFVLFDPFADDEGLLLVGDDPDALNREAMAFLD